MSYLIPMLTTPLLVSFCEGATQSCNGEYECGGQAISNSGSGDVSVRGYKSNSGPTSSIFVSGTSERVYIQSEFGAYNISSISMINKNN